MVGDPLFRAELGRLSYQLTHRDSGRENSTPSAARADRKCPEGRVKDAVFDETIKDR